MSNIYMEYLTESEREDLILEKELNLIDTNIDYLFTTYEATNTESKKNMIQKIGKKIRELIDYIVNKLIPMIKQKLRKKKENPKKIDQLSQTEIKLLPESNPRLDNDESKKNVDKNVSVQPVLKTCIAEGAEDLFNHLEKMSVETTPIINNFNKLISENNEKALVILDKTRKMTDNFLLKMYDYGTKRGIYSDVTSKVVLSKDQNIEIRINIISTNMEKELKRLKEIINKNNQVFLNTFDDIKDEKRNAFYEAEHVMYSLVRYIEDIIKYTNKISDTVVYVEVVKK